MKIFISWSGPRSLAVATALKSWIKAVLQATEPWISSGGIERGSAWREKLRKELQDTDTGIVCITKANRESSWLLFESGAIAKLENSHTCTVLVDLKSGEVKDPLAQFQATELTRDSLRQMLKEFNARLPEKSRLDDETFSTSFDAHWPNFEKKLAEAAKTAEQGSATPPRSADDMLEEILKTTRQCSKTLSEMQFEKDAERAGRALNNIIRNALQSTPEGERVIIDAFPQNQLEDFAKMGIAVTSFTDGQGNSNASLKTPPKA